LLVLLEVESNLSEDMNVNVYGTEFQFFKNDGNGGNGGKDRTGIRNIIKQKKKQNIFFSMNIRN